VVRAPVRNIGEVVGVIDSTAPAPPRSSLLRRVITYTPGSLVPAALALVTSMIFTRIFDPVEFGTYSLFLVVASPVKFVFTTWLTQSIGKFIPQEQTVEGRQRVRDAVFLSTVMVFVVETVLGVVAFVVLQSVLSQSWRRFLFPVVLFVVVTSVFEILSTVFSMENRAREFVTYRLVDSVATLALRLLLVSAVFRMDSTLMFWSVVASNGVLLPFMWAQAGFPAPTRLVGALLTEQTRRLAIAFLGFGLPMTLWYFSSILLDVGDRYVLNFLQGPGQVGVYDASYRLIAGVAALMVVPVTMTLHPYLMGISGSDDADRIGRVIGTIVENLFLLGALCVGLTFLLHRDVAKILLGSQFRGGSIVMPIVLAGVFFFNIGTFAHKPFEIVGRTRVMVTFGLVSAAANVVLCFVLIPHVGYIGAAYSTLIAYLFYTVCVGALGRRIFRWHIDLRKVLVHGGVICGGVAAIHLLRTAMSGLPYVWGLTVTVLAGCVLAAGSLLGLFRNGLAAATSAPVEGGGSS